MTTLNFQSANGGDSGNGQLLRDIEELSKALYLPKASQRTLISSINAGSMLDSNFNDNEEKINREKKKSSAWPWKPLRALSHIRQKKFNCCFFCHVHHIENLPPNFDGLDMSVQWKRKDNLVRTLVSRVCNGLVEFEDTLINRCSVYGARSGHGNFVKYEPKHFLLYADVVGLKEIDIGKHWIDLTRLLPLVFEELEEDKCSGKWTTSFKLGGTAKGATLHVSFGFLVMNDSLQELDNSMRLPLVFDLKQLTIDDCAANRGPGNGSGMLRRAASVPSSIDCGSSSSSQCSDVKVLHQVWPNPMWEFSGSVDILYRKLDEDIMDASRKFDSNFENSESFESLSNPDCDAVNDAFGNECVDDDNGAEFTITERGIELEWPMEDQLESEESTAKKLDNSSVELLDVSDFKDEFNISDEDVKLNQTANGSAGCLASCSCELEQNNNIEELDNDIWNIFISESVESEPLWVGSKFLEEEMLEDESSNPGPSKMISSLSLDLIMKAVTDDFCKLVGGKHDPYNSSQSSSNGSPRELLLREFEKDAMNFGSFLYDSDTQKEVTEFSYSGLTISTSNRAKEDIANFPTINNAMADLIASQPTASNTKPNMLESLETQSLMQRWGLDEEAFLNSPDSSTGGFGSPIYLPPDEPAKLPSLGEGLGPVLQLNDGGFLRSMSPSLFIGSKNGGTLIIQVSKPSVLPAAMGTELLDVLQGMAFGGLELMTKQAREMMPLADLSGKIIQTLACSEEMSGRDEMYVKLESWGSSTGDDYGFEDISIKELVPLVMDSIESLSIEGLRIQSGMSDSVAPLNITMKDGNGHSEFRKNGEIMESLMDLSLPLDEWLRLDSGILRDSETASRLMVAHRAKTNYFSMGNSIKDNVRENASMKCGLLEDDLVIGLRIQLRDPLRDFESVGAPMIVLIQVRREFDNSDLAIYSEESAEEDNTDEFFKAKSFKGECVARFVLEEVHLAGLATELGKEEIWASKRQQQSGYRWLIANNMDSRHKVSKSQLSKSSALTISRVFKKRQTGNILWSISHQSRKSGDRQKESSITQEDSYLRNPDVYESLVEIFYILPGNLDSLKLQAELIALDWNMSSDGYGFLRRLTSINGAPIVVPVDQHRRMVSSQGTVKNLDKFVLPIADSMMCKNLQTEDMHSLVSYLLKKRS
ncbi:hypothetical protein V2J09_010050 [Rumex salicifolius]